MRKAKSKSTVMAPDASGKLTEVIDRRFDNVEWPISFEVPTDEADDWFDYLSAVGSERGWTITEIRQIDASENSGSKTITSNEFSDSQLAVIWERKRNRKIKVRARSVGTTDFPLGKAREFFDRVNKKSHSKEVNEFRRFWYLAYRGLPWQGELWLDERLRLGPPSQQDEAALIGPRIIVVHARLHGINFIHANDAFRVLLRELSAFLTVVVGLNVRVLPNGDRDWILDVDPNGQVHTRVGDIGYFEPQSSDHFPEPGEFNPVPTFQVTRPEFELRRHDFAKTEIDLPSDISDLWKRFRNLPDDRQQQLLQVADLWQLANSLGSERETARFSLMVAAIEALKPDDVIYDKHNIYDVADGLLGESVTNLLKGQLQSQRVRNDLLHRGKFRGSEFKHETMNSSFMDPTFSQNSEIMYKISRAAIIEWLRRDGLIIPPPLRKGKKTWKRRVKENFAISMAIAFGIGLGAGCIIRGSSKE